MNRKHSPHPLRLGALLIFKKNVSKAEAKKRLDQLKDILDPNQFIEYEEDNFQKYHKVPFILKEYEEDYGSPVWYIP